MHTPQHGNELYRDNGTTLEQLTDLRVGSESGVYGGHNIMYAFKGKIFFAGYDSIDRVILYQYDPLSKSVSSINNPWTQASYYPSHFAEYHGKLFFSCADTVHGTELYVYDGINPPYLAADVMQGKASSEPHHLTIFKNDLYFAGLSSVWQIELYRYNDSALIVPTFPSGVMKTAQDQLYNITIYPNPSSQDAYLDMELNEAQNLLIRVSDINGRIVHTLDSKLYSQGKHTISLPLANMPAGTYFYSIFDKNAGQLSGGQIIKR
ncbi:MAG: T9SS type A sorting domain-containing protein [Taibaiella sp.]|nr:T9SS type A sorting domain-containing protein [Taibaiella sp.]